MITTPETDPLGWKGLLPGTRVIVYDYSLFQDDKKTPAKTLHLPATVVRHYGELEQRYTLNELILGPYSSCVDVIFDHREHLPHENLCRVSRGHFTTGIQLMEVGESDS